MSDAKTNQRVMEETEKLLDDDVVTLLHGDALTILRTLSADSVQCCVTSPPYWGLRDYGVAGQYGLEQTPEDYVAKMVALFRDVRRVLTPDGVCWLNLGDSYATGGGAVGRCPGGGDQGARFIRAGMINTQPNRMPLPGFKRKDLIGIPWRVAFALQADGWYLRQDIIWHKPNPMPESVRDRCTKAHEYIFMLTKSARYYYDADAIKEPVSGTAHARGNGVNPKAAWKTPDGWDTSKGDGGHGNFHRKGREKGKIPGKNSRIHVDRDPAHLIAAKKPRQNESFSAAVKGLVDFRNRRSVWVVAPHPFTQAHFATFPPEIPQLCIMATSRPGDTVLDPFNGAGTTGMVAQQFGRKYIGIDLNEQYLAMTQRRLAQGSLELGGTDE